MHKKGELVSLIVIGIMLVITAILVLVKGGIILTNRKQFTKDYLSGGCLK